MNAYGICANYISSCFNYDRCSSIRSTLGNLCAKQVDEQHVFSAVDRDKWMVCVYRTYVLCVVFLLFQEDLYQCFEEFLAAVNHCKRLLETVPVSSDLTSLNLSKSPPFLDTNGREVCQTCIDKLKVHIRLNAMYRYNVYVSFSGYSR